MEKVFNHIKVLVVIFIIAGVPLEAGDCLPAPAWVWNPPTNGLYAQAGYVGRTGATAIIGTYENPGNAPGAFVLGSFSIYRRDFSSISPGPVAVDDSNALYCVFTYSSYGTYRRHSRLERLDAAGNSTLVADGYTYGDLYSSFQFDVDRNFSYLERSSQPAFFHHGAASFMTDAESIVGDWAGNWITIKRFQKSYGSAGGMFTSQGGTDLIMSRLSPYGIPLWTKQFGGPADESLFDVATASDGIYLVGAKGPGASNIGGFSFDNDGGVFLVKLTYEGDVVWVTQIPGIALGGIAADLRGGCFIRGVFSDSQGQHGSVVRKYGTDGQPVSDFSNSLGVSVDSINSLIFSEDNHLTISGRLAAPGTIGCINLISQGTNFVVANFDLSKPATISFAAIAASRSVVAENSSFNLYSSVLGTRPILYQWLRDGVPIAGATKDRLSISSAGASDAGVYSLVASNAVGSVTSGPVSISINQSLAFTRTLVSKTISAGSTVDFSISYRSASPAVVRWFHDDVEIPGATTDTFHIEAASVRDLGKYSAIVQSAGAAITNQAILDFDAAYPNAQLTQTLPTGQTYDSFHIADFFPDGKILMNEFNSGPSYAFSQLKVISTTGSISWQSAVQYDNTSYVFRGMFSPSGRNVFAGLDTAAASSAYGTNLPNLFPRWTQIEISSSGQFQWINSYPINANRFQVQPGGQIVVNGYAGDNELLVLDAAGNQLARGAIQSGFILNGLAFAAPPGKVTFLEEFDQPPVSKTNWVFGRYDLDGRPGWAKELSLPYPSFSGLSSETPAAVYPNSEYLVTSSVDDALIVLLNEYPAKTHIFKITRNGIAWEVLVTEANATSSPSAIWTQSPFGALTIAMSARNQISVGDKIIPAQANDSASVMFTIDAGGKVRNAQRWTSLGDPLRKLTREGPQIYWGLSSTNRMEFILPEPDITIPPNAELFQTVAAGESVTLRASPDVPGVAQYRWFKDGALITGSDKELRIVPFGFRDDGAYTVNIHNAFGSITNRVATLTYMGSPGLYIQRLGGEAIANWSMAATGFRLQETTNLLVPFANAAISLRTNASTKRIEATLPQESSPRFFRLAK